MSNVARAVDMRGANPHQPAEHLRPAPIVGNIDPEVTAREAARLAAREAGNEPKAPGSYKAGEVNPVEHEAAQRAVHGLAVDLEKAAREAAEREAAIDGRIAEARSEAAVEPESLAE
jgi:hypothetical protein